MNIPIYRAKKIDSDEYIEGWLKYNKKHNHYLINPINEDNCWYCIDLSTLEISDGLKFRKVSECNFRTDYEMDMHNYNGYVNGWNNALKDNGKPPYKLYETIKNNKE